MTIRQDAVNSIQHLNSIKKVHVEQDGRSENRYGSGVHSPGGSVRARMAIEQGQKELEQARKNSPQGQRDAWEESVRWETARVARLAAEAAQKRKNAAIEAERVRAAHQWENERRREHAEQVADRALQDATKREILGVIEQYGCMDKLPELTELVRGYGFGMSCVLSWETACQEIGRKHGTKA
jgi:hypothetical protein